MTTWTAALQLFASATEYIQSTVVVPTRTAPSQPWVRTSVERQLIIAFILSIKIINSWNIIFIIYVATATFSLPRSTSHFLKVLLLYREWASTCLDHHCCWELQLWAVAGSQLRSPVFTQRASSEENTHRVVDLSGRKLLFTVEIITWSSIPFHGS